MDPIFRALERYALRQPGDPAMFQLSCTLGEELKDLSRAAAAAGVTLHTIGTRGLNAVPSATGGKQAFLTMNSLRMLAATTGGTTSTSNDFVGAFEEIDSASRDFYVLGYVPEETADGRYRHVVVRSRRKGVTLRFRKGFTRLPPDEARERAIEAAHLFPEMLQGGDAMTLDAVDGPGDRKGRTVDLVLHLPADRLLFRPGPEGATARLTVGFVGIDAGRHETLRTARRAALTRTQDAGDAIAGINCFHRARLPLAAQTVTAVVRDDLSGWIGAARLEIGADPEPRRALHGPSLYAVDEDSVWIEVPPDSNDLSPGLDVTVRATGPASRTTFFPGESIVAAFRRADGPDLPGAFRIDVLRGNDVVRSTPVAATGPAAAGQPVKTRVGVAGLAAGTYRLSVREIVAGREIERGAKRFRIAERGRDTAPIPTRATDRRPAAPAPAAPRP